MGAEFGWDHVHLDVVVDDDDSNKDWVPLYLLMKTMIFRYLYRETYCEDSEAVPSSV